MRRLVLLLSAAAAFGFAVSPAPSFAAHYDNDPKTESIPPRADKIEMIDGYVPVSDGTKLRMQAEYPKDRPSTGLPTLLLYQGYSHKLGDPAGDRFRDWAMHNGYAVMVVSVRGAGCSGGSYDFLSKQEAEDGRDVIDWITGTGDAEPPPPAQPWSNGKVAMIGDSYTGFEQLPVAALRPEGLVAIAPGQPIADLYRDVGYPGGISNTFLTTAFSATVLVDTPPHAPHESLGSLARDGVDNPNRRQCVANQTGAPVGLTGTSAALVAANRWDEGAIRDRAPGRNIAKINVPTFTVVAWQDEAVGSRAIVELPKVSGPFHAVLSNGGHGWNAGVWYAERTQERLHEFLDFYVRGIDNGFDAQPPIEVWWESQRPPADPAKPDGPRKDPDGEFGLLTAIEPRWTTGLSRMPAAQERETTLALSQGGQLTWGAGSGGPDQYEYVGGTGQYRGGLPTQPDWSDPPDRDKSLVYTSPPLEKDLVVLGSGSLDLWLDSTATDTDVQAVLTEVRPDQKETYVQAGWLRASHRKLDPARSIPTRPFHTHQRADTQLLTPLKPELMRVEIRPFGHVFRAGSRLRLSIEAPPRTTGAWSFESLPGPALNRVYHDLAHPSALRLATLPGHRAPVGYPKCGTVVRQPCRASP